MAAMIYCASAQRGRSSGSSQSWGSCARRGSSRRGSSGPRARMARDILQVAGLRRRRLSSAHCHKVERDHQERCVPDSASDKCKRQLSSDAIHGSHECTSAVQEVVACRLRGNRSGSGRGCSWWSNQGWRTSPRRRGSQRAQGGHADGLDRNPVRAAWYGISRLSSAYCHEVERNHLQRCVSDAAL